MTNRLSPKIVFTGWGQRVQELIWNDNSRDAAERLGFNVEILSPRENAPSTDEWRHILKDAEAILTTWGSPRIDEQVLAENKVLKFVGHAAGSVAGVASDYLYEHGIPLCSANEEMAAQVARGCLMMTMFGLNGFLYKAQFGSGNRMNWDNSKTGLGIRNAVIGIWGFGDISKRYLEYLRPFDPKEVLICSRSLGADKAAALGMRKVELEELFATADLVQVLQGLTPQTARMVGSEHLSSMKDGAILMNAGRANLIQEEALYAELKRNRIQAILDVYYEEPLPEDSPLVGLPNVVLTPHCIGWDGPVFYAVNMMEELDRLLRGEPLQFQVSRERANLMTDERLRKG